MKSRKVLAWKNLPTRCPLMGTLVLWLLLDRLDAVGWVWGAVGVVMLIGWLGWIIDTFKDEQIEVIK